MILNLILDQPGAWKYAGCKLVRPVGILNVAQNNLTFDLPQFFWRNQTWVEMYSKNSISKKNKSVGPSKTYKQVNATNISEDGSPKWSFTMSFCSICVSGTIVVGPCHIWFGWLLDGLVGYLPNDKHVAKHSKLFTDSCMETALYSLSHEPYGNSMSIMECFWEQRG